MIEANKEEDTLAHYIFLVHLIQTTIKPQRKKSRLGTEYAWENKNKQKFQNSRCIHFQE